jgi:predicted RNase H-like nuclease
MNSTRKFVGVDGCRSGWCAVIFDGRNVRAALYNNVAELWQGNKGAGLILIDMPIGILDNATDRPCDYAVRKLIGRRRSSLFPMPCRATLSEATYREASQTNFEITGRKLSKEMWNIMPKMRELDDFLAENLEARNIIKETHPELCLAGLNGGTSMEYAKKKDREKGFVERLDVLRRYNSDSSAIIEKALKEHRRKDVARDDIVDALALAITASHGEEKLTVIKSDPTCDSHGLPMQMVYYLKKA